MVETALPCPFCGCVPHVGPDNPKKQGDAWGYVECLSEECPANPQVFDHEQVSDSRGSDEYKNAAIKRWNQRQK
jgi:hypothetical protein